MHLRTVIYAEDYSMVLRLSGPLTRHSVPSLEEPLVRVLEPIGQRLVLDLAGVTECDSAGAAALLGIWGMSRERGGETSFACPTPAVRAWLELAAFGDVAVYRTIDGADRADPGQRIDPLTRAAPQPRRAFRSRPHHRARPANAANAVYARPDGAPANRNRPRT